ncbi:hypothetical protein JG687_00012895 [Phytophthora cactorum]|uniref:Uncharacterized protein n=1 Tax=Phytophthora cactorum TaxID=29920 RepID=A0A8T1U2Y6_9STRA|nr:hypothetical protein JG687_00012895 [Phytophthora cactorum]
MICCGCSLDVDGVWRVKQLNPHLQELIKKYPAEFARSNKKSDAAEKQCAPHATNQSDTVIIARPKFKVWHGCITYVALYLHLLPRLYTFELGNVISSTTTECIR